MSVEAVSWGTPGVVPGLRDVLRSLVTTDTESVWQLGDEEVAEGLAGIGRARQLLEAVEVSLIREGVQRGLPSESGWSAHDWVSAVEGERAPLPPMGHVSAAVRVGRAGATQVGTRAEAGDPDGLAGVTGAVLDGDLPLGKADQLARFHERVSPVADSEELTDALATLLQAARDEEVESGPEGRGMSRVRGLTEKELAVAIRTTERLLKPERDQDDEDRRAKAGRSLTKGPGPCGLAQYKVILDAEGAAVVDSALAALSGPVKGPDGEPDPRSAARRRADALIEIVGRGVSSPGEQPTTEKAQVVVTIGLDALLGPDRHGPRGAATGAPTSGAPTSGIVGRGSPATGFAGSALATGSGIVGIAKGSGISGLAKGSGVTATGEVLPPSVVRRMACDGGIIPAVLGGVSEVLDLGRTVRWFTPGQKKALWLRDGGCTFPGCTMPPQWTDAHHVGWWSRGGGTDITNGALLCGRHHTHVHTHDLSATITGTGVTWHL